MPKADLTLAELERILEEKKRRLADLHRKRTQLERRLGTVSNKIARIQGTGGRGRPTSKAGPKDKDADSVPSRRARNDRPLREVVADVLRQHKDGLSIADLADKVLGTGYQTTSTNFKNTLYQTLYHHDEFQLDKATGLYTVSKPASK